MDFAPAVVAALGDGRRWMFPWFLSAFLSIYAVGRVLFFRRWRRAYRLEAASCLISLFHGTPAVVLAAAGICTAPARSYASPNAPFQDLVLDFSVAYFTVDMLHYLLFIPSDVLFIAHHAATLFVFLTCRCLVRHGAYALLVLLVLAEATSPLQNAWTLAGLKKADLPSSSPAAGAAARFHRRLSLPFFLLYTSIRAVVAPVVFLGMARFYLSGAAGEAIPYWICVAWVAVIGTAIAVSILWIWSRWKEFLIEGKKMNSHGSEKKDS